MDARGGRECLEAEPGAGLSGGNWKGHTLAENVDGQLESLDGRRAERERLLRLRDARGIGEAGQRQVPCLFDKHGEITEKFSVRAEAERLLNSALRKIVRCVVAGNRGAIVGELRVFQLIDFAGGAAADAGRSPTHRTDSGAGGAADERGRVCGEASRRAL